MVWRSVQAMYQSTRDRTVSRFQHYGVRAKMNYPVAYDAVTSCFGMCRRRRPVFRSVRGNVLDANGNADKSFIENITDRLPLNTAADMWHASTTLEMRRYFMWMVRALLTILLITCAGFCVRLVSDWRHERYVQSIMKGSGLAEGASFTLWSYGNVDMKTYSDVDQFMHDRAMLERCRPLSRREYVTRTLDHHFHLSQRLSEVDFRHAADSPEFEGDLRAAMSLDLEMLAHAMCHHAHELHVTTTRSNAPVFVTPKMLKMRDLRVAMQKGGGEDMLVSDFVDIGDFHFPDVCMMAYVRPDDDLSRADVRSEAVPDTPHGRKPFEKDLGVDTDAFTHRTNFAVWPDNAGFDERMAIENAERMYVVGDDGGDGTTRSWWNSALYLMGPPGECAIYANPAFSNSTHVRYQDRGNHMVDVYRNSAVVPAHRGKQVVYGSRVWRKGVVEHDVVLNTTLPDALMRVNGTKGFLHDGVDAMRAQIIFETLEKQAESQIVINLMNGKWNIFDEIERGVDYDQKRARKHG